MRNLMKKIIVILFLALMLINNSLLMVIANAVDEVQSLIDESKVKAITEMNLEKYVNYSLGDESKGLMMQLNLKSGIEYEEGQEYIPINSTGIRLNFPKVKDKFPEKIEVVGISTRATNGGEQAKDWQYEYDSENGEFKLVAVNNQDENGNIYSENVENARDEYRVIAYYGEECYSDKVDKTNIKLDGEVQIILADDNETQISSKIEKEFEVEDNISGLITEEIITDDIFKGYIYSNIKNATNYETIFNEKAELNISYKEIADEISFSNTTQFTYKDGNSVDTSDVIYKSTKINKNEVLQILGEDGKLEILDQNGKILLEINNNTEVSDDGIVEVNYEEETTGIVIKTTKPVNVGTITINNTKAIKSTMVDNNVNGIKTNIEIICKNEKQSEQEEQEKELKEVYQFKNEQVTELKEPETKIEARIDNKDWLSYTNNNVNFHLTLLSNEAKYDLFTNPVIEIKLPEEVEKVVLGDVHPLYGGNLSIKTARVLENVIRIELDGAQNEYFSNSMIEGTNIIVPATIVVRKDISSTQSNMELTYTNENATSIDYINESKSSKAYSVNIITSTVSDEPKPILDGEDEGSIKPSSEDSQEKMISADIKATVGKKQLQNNDEVYEDQIIKYTIKLKNITNERIENVNIIGSIPEGTHFATVDYGTEYESTHDPYDLYKYVTDDSKTEWNLKDLTLESGVEAEVYYEVKVSELAEGEVEKAINSNIKINVGDSNKVEYSLNNVVKKAEISVELKSTKVAGEENLVVYNIYIFNNLDVDINNVNVEIELPEEMKYAYASDDLIGTAEENNNKVKIKVDNIKANSVLGNTIFASLRGIDDNITQYEPKVVAVVSADNTNVYNSNENRIILYASGIEIVQTSTREGENIEYEEEVEYDIVIKNTSNENYEDKVYNINVKDYIDKNLEFSRVEYEYFEENDAGIYEKKSSTDEMMVLESIEEDDETNNIINIETALPIGESINIKIVLKADAVFERTEVSHKVDVIYGDKTKSSNVIKNNILPLSSTQNPNPDPDDNEAERHSISGIAWLDENRDGQMNSNEKKFSDITVKLFNANTGNIVKDENGNNLQVKTDDDGKYEFKNLEKGNYLVIFEYDNSKYTTTTYKQNGVSESANSDVIEQQASIDNNKVTVAASDILEIDSANIEYINIGLVEKVKFDLNLNKTITKVTTTYNGKTSEKDYNSTKLAKVEIPAKQISNTTLVVEYQIEVKNEGNIDAYVDEIIDYLPKELEFNIESNSDWSRTSDGNLKNTSLAGKKIAPGESQIVKLNLVKTTSDNSIGTITNGAEILKSSNFSGVTDIDSVAGNKNVSEDDYSEAELIVSIKTGATVYFLIILELIIILIVIKVLIDKKIINIKNIKMVVLLAIVVGAVLCFDYSNAVTNIKPTGTTKEEIEKELKEGYASVVVTLRYGVGYKHYGSSHSKGELYCSDGNSMCSHENHYYKFAGITNFRKVKGGTSAPLNMENVKLTKSDSYAKLKDYNKNSSIAGPFKVAFTGTIKISSVTTDLGTIDKDDYAIVDDDGNRIKIESGERFFIKIPQPDAEKVTIKVTATGKTYTIKTEYKISYTEIWRCTGTCNYSSLHTPQVMHKEMELNLVESKNKTSEKSVTLTAGREGGPTHNRPPPGDPDDPKPGTSNGALVLQKVDDRDTDIPLENVGFIFSTQVNVYEWYSSYDHYHWVTRYQVVILGHREDGSLILGTQPYQSWEYWWTENFYHWVTKTMYLNTNYQWSESRNSAKVFYTDSDGMISVPTLKLPNDTHVTNEGALGVNYYQAQNYVNTDVLAIEVSNGNYGYSPEIGKSYNITRHEAGYSEEAKVLENHQKYVKLSGYVWLDEHDGKDTVRNDQYDTGKESGFNGIQVYLKNSYGNTIKTTQTSELGLYSEINGGEYQFTEVDLDELQAGNYHVEFEYNGFIYEAVASNIYDETGSKAEDTNSRNVLDNAFESVNGNGSQTLNMTQGIKVNYSNIDSNEYRSTVVGSENTNVIASTDQAGCDLEEYFEPTMEEIRYINFGVYEKVQADYALTKDLYNVRVEVNGKSHIYRYGSTRYSDAGGNVDEDSSWNVGVKFQNNKGTYSRAIYKADAEFKSPGEPDKELKVFATYKIALKNESSYLGRINSIVDYCDDDFDLVAAGAVLYEENDTVYDNISRSLDETYNGNGYKKYILNVNTEIHPGATEFIYIQFQIKKDAVLGLMNSETDVLNNVAEINSYTTFRDYNTNLPLAVVDQDSVPGNVIPGDTKTYEDDTDAARSLRLKIANARAIEGIVFEDLTGKDSDGVYEGEERRGDGIYKENEEKPLEGITVTLRNIDGSIAKIHDELEPDENNRWKDAITETDSNGEFSFVGYIPGNYVLTYTWGNKDYKVQYYKGTIYNEQRSNSFDGTKKNTFWYRGSEYGDDIISSKDRYMDAFDDIEARKLIDAQMKAIDINTLEGEIDEAYNRQNNVDEPITVTSMDSTTPEMEFSVEYETTITDGNAEQVRFTIENVDFGIVERAKQKLYTSKRVTAFKITLANGQVLVDATVNEEGKLEGVHNYTTYMGPVDGNSGMIKMEVDNELIEGATLDVTYKMIVKNIGEVDYVSDRYYYYGNSTGSDKVEVSVAEFIDYIDKRLAIKEENENDWEEKDKDYLKDVNAKQKGEIDYLNERRTYITKKLSEFLAPGESNEYVMNVSKLLTSTDDNTFTNDTEIAKVEKNDGNPGPGNETISSGTPVKVNWSDDKQQSYFEEASAEDVVIIPSTGENKDYVLITIIGMTSLAMIGLGAFGIKKFVIDK